MVFAVIDDGSYGLQTCSLELLHHLRMVQAMVIMAVMGGDYDHGLFLLDHSHMVIAMGRVCSSYPTVGTVIGIVVMMDRISRGHDHRDGDRITCAQRVAVEISRR